VRETSVFTFTPELESMLRTQFEMLNETFDYHNSDLLIWGDLSNNNTERYLVQIVEKIIDDEQELFRIEILSTGASILVSRFELDYWNGSGGSLPMDSLIEVIDWSNDRFWQKKLNDFKLFMVKKNFSFNFLGTEADLLSQREEIVANINSFFALNENHLVQKGRGIGFLSCGSGTNQDQLVVLTFAMQAFAQPFGITSRLWGQSIGFEYMPTHLTTRFGRKRSPSNLDFMSLAIKNPEVRPIQRPLSEVLKRVLAKGPFGKWESLVYIKSKENCNSENDLFVKSESDI
jgi:hypothetical protein